MATRVLAAGIFDILHLGHIHYLAHAKSLGDELIVVIGTDRMARKLGKNPIHNERERLAMINALKVVDKTVLGDKNDMLITLKKINPDIVFLGYDQDLSQKMRDYCKTHKIKVMKDPCTLDVKRYKTTAIKERVVCVNKKKGRYNADALMALARKSAVHCPWCKEKSCEEFVHELENEVRELAGALSKMDYANVREEIGDVVWDALVLAHICEREGKFNGDDVIREIIRKIERRKPYLINGDIVSLEEAKRIWHEAKRKEKEGRK